MVRKKIFKKGLAFALAVAMTFSGTAISLKDQTTTAKAAEAEAITLPIPVYSFNFDGADVTAALTNKGSAGGVASVVGGGTVEKEAGGNGYFDNNSSAATGGRGVDYLAFPNVDSAVSAIKKDESNSITFSAKIKLGDAGYVRWSPVLGMSIANDLNWAGCYPFFNFELRGTAGYNAGGGYYDGNNSDDLNVPVLDELSKDEWATLTIVCDAAGKDIKTYVNGVLAYDDKDCFSADSIGKSIFEQITKISLGGPQYCWNDVDARVLFDDVKLFSAALTKKEVKAIANGVEGTDYKFDSLTVTANDVNLVLNNEEAKTATITPKSVQNIAGEVKYSYKSADETVATVDTTGKVTAVKVGTTDVTVTASIGTGEDAVTATTISKVKVTDDPKSLAISAEGLDESGNVTVTREFYKNNAKGTEYKDATLDVSAAVTPDDATYEKVTWSSSDEDVFTVTADSKDSTKAVVKAVGTTNNGTATITAAIGDVKKEITAKLAIKEIETVQPKTVEIVEPTELAVGAGGVLQFKAKVNGETEDATIQRVAWSVKGKATIDEDTGLLTVYDSAVAGDKIVVTAVAKEDETVKTSATVTVNSYMMLDADDVKTTAFWAAHSKGILLPDGENIKITFTNTSDADSTSNWHGPVWALYYADEQFAGGANLGKTKGYAEQYVMRGDCYGWAGDKIEGTGSYVSTTPSKWDDYLAAVKAGADGEIVASRNGSTVTVTMTVGGAKTVYTQTGMTSSTKDLYLSLGGEKTTITNIKYLGQAPVIDEDSAKLALSEDSKSLIFTYKNNVDPDEVSFTVNDEEYTPGYKKISNSGKYTSVVYDITKPGAYAVKVTAKREGYSNGTSSANIIVAVDDADAGTYKKVTDLISAVNAKLVDNDIVLTYTETPNAEPDTVTIKVNGTEYTPVASKTSYTDGTMTVKYSPKETGTYEFTVEAVKEGYGSTKKTSSKVNVNVADDGEVVLSDAVVSALTITKQSATKNYKLAWTEVADADVTATLSGKFADDSATKNVANGDTVAFADLVNGESYVLIVTGSATGYKDTTLYKTFVCDKKLYDAEDLETQKDALIAEKSIAYNGENIEISVDKKYDLSSLEVSVNGTKINEDCSPVVGNAASINLAKGTLNIVYPYEGTGKYEIAVTAKKDTSSQGKFADQTIKKTVDIQEIDGKLYQIDSSLLKTALSVSSNDTDYIIDFEAADADVATTVTVKDSEGVTIATDTKKLNLKRNDLTLKETYSVELVAKKDNNIIIQNETFKCTRPVSGYPDNLVGYYTFEDSLKNVAAEDNASAVAKEHAGAVGGDGNFAAKLNAAGVSYGTGADNKGLVFTGNNDNGYGNGLLLDAKMSKNFTISAWVKAEETVSFQSIFFMNPDPENLNKGMSVLNSYINVSTDFNGGFPGALMMKAGWDDGNVYWLDKNDPASESTTKVIPKDEWVFVTYTLDEKGKATIYYNGEILSTKETDFAAANFENWLIYLGINRWDASFKGTMDNVAVYNEALSKVEVKSLYENNGVPENALKGDMIKDSAVKVADDGSAIELSFKKGDVDPFDVSVTVNGEKFADNAAVKAATDANGVTTLKYTAKEDGEYKFVATATKADNTVLYTPDVEEQTIDVVVIDGKVYTKNDKLLTAAFKVEKQADTSDAAYKVSYTPAEGVTATLTVTDANGAAVAVKNGAIARTSLKDGAKYTIKLVATKGTEIVVNEETVTYIAPKEIAATSKWAKIKTQPLYYWDFDSATENGLEVSSAAKVTGGVLDLTANDGAVANNAYAKLPSLASDDFSNGMTVTMKVMLTAAPTNSWTKFFIFGNSALTKGINSGEFCYGMTPEFNNLYDANDTSHKTGFYGSGIVVLNGQETTDPVALTSQTEVPYEWNWYYDASKLNRWDTITVSIAKDGTLKTYYDGVLVEKYKDASFAEILTWMKKANSNFLGTSYFTADPDLVGKFDDFAIYNTVLSDADVKTLTGDIVADKTEVVKQVQDTQNKNGVKSAPSFLDGPNVSKNRKKITAEFNIKPTKVTESTGKGTVKISGKTVTITYKSALKLGTKVKVTAYNDTASKSATVTVKGTITIKSVKAKKNTKKVTGKLSVKKATVKVRIKYKGKKKYTKYKKAKVSGKKFTFKAKKMKKGTKVQIKVTKKNYKTKTKTVKVK